MIHEERGALLPVQLSLRRARPAAAVGKPLAHPIATLACESARLNSGPSLGPGGVGDRKSGLIWQVAEMEGLQKDDIDQSGAPHLSRPGRRLRTATLNLSNAASQPPELSLASLGHFGRRLANRHRSLAWDGSHD